MEGDLWSCPECGRRFAHPHQWHSCIELGLAERLADASEAAVDLYRAVEKVVAGSGDYRVHPQKTRIAFIERMTFASVSLARRWIDVGFVTATPIGDERVRAIDMYGPTSLHHTIRLVSPDEIDDDVRAWLAAAHRRGSLETLDPGAEVDPVVGAALERLRIPLRARVVEAGGVVGVAVPGWAADAFGAHPDVSVRLAGADHLARIAVVDDRPVLVLDTASPAELGLGVGDPIDAFLRASL